MKLLRRVWFGAVLATLFATTLAAAEVDPPGRVARLQYMNGSVSVQPRGVEDWVAANLNRPLTTSDNIWTDRESRAELNVGTGVLRLDSETSLTLTNVGDNTVQVQLHQGVLNLRVRKLYRGEIYEVDTPNIAFTVQKSGRYRFDVGPSGEVTLVTVSKGEGDATGDGPAVRVRAHERARFTNGTSLAHEIYSAPPNDGFDDWCLVRDRREDNSVSAQYVAPGVIGYQDLDDYGAWQTVPAYGPVWVPAHVSYGWAPYRYGHWAWISPWGWTWVDDASWGFAPYHYGRWVYVGYWAWVPGPVYVRPVYAPALVAWFGGEHFGSRPLLRRRIWLVPAWVRRAVHSVVRRKPRLLPASQRHQYAHYEYYVHHQQLLQRSRPSSGASVELCELENSGSSHRGSARCS